MKFRRQNLRVDAADAKRDERTGVSEYGRAHDRRDLAQKLVHQGEAQLEFAALARECRERVLGELPGAVATL